MSNAQDQTPESTDVPTSPSAVERLRSLYRADGPFVSVYVAGATHNEMHEAWERVKPGLVDAGAPDNAIQAIDARISLGAPPYTAGHCVIAAADGTTVVDHGAEPPIHDLGVVDTLPYSAPLLEWDQRRVAHVVAVFADDEVDITSFSADHRVESITAPTDPTELAAAVVAEVGKVDAELVVLVGGPARTQELSDHLVTALPIECRLVATDIDEVSDLASTVVRMVSDHIARTTVGNLRDFRFLRSHDEAVDGIEDSIAAVRTGSADKILVHDDPQDQRRVWVGSQPADLSLDMIEGHIQARMVDALIRSAILQGIDIYVIPTTGNNGPEDHTAALTH